MFFSIQNQSTNFTQTISYKLIWYYPFPDMLCLSSSCNFFWWVFHKYLTKQNWDGRNMNLLAVLSSVQRWGTVCSGELLSSQMQNCCKSDLVNNYFFWATHKNLVLVLRPMNFFTWSQIKDDRISLRNMFSVW